MSKWCNYSILKLYDELSLKEVNPVKAEMLITELVVKDRVKSRYSRNPRLIKFLLTKTVKKKADDTNKMIQTKNEKCENCGQRTIYLIAFQGLMFCPACDAQLRR